MSIKRSIALAWAQRRLKQLEAQALQAPQLQEKLLHRLLAKARTTQFGREHHFGGIRSLEDYRATVPLRTYEQLQPWIDRAYEGQKDVLWPGKPLYFAKTSGTTAGAKHIPISKASMPLQVRGARDTLLAYIARTGNTAFLDGKMMFLSGSPKLGSNAAGVAEGRLSGISAHFVPGYLQRNRVPTFETNCIEDWDRKVDAIVNEIRTQDLRLISGIPPWVQQFFERTLALTGQAPAQLWPNLQVFVHGGVDYRPYETLLAQAAGTRLDLVETYPASEGFIAFQDRRDDNQLLLNLSGGIFFEFVPLRGLDSNRPARLSLAEVETGVDYAIVLTTNAGLWSYVIGDTVRFSSTAPPRLRVSGRVKHFLSAFGEHVIEEEVNQAMLQACRTAGGQVVEYTVAPWIAGANSAHEWWVEFAERPPDLTRFAEALDNELRRQNMYYNDLRNGGTLREPLLRCLRPGATADYMRERGKLGGQNKFPRLNNTRSIAEGLQDKLHPDSWSHA